MHPPGFLLDEHIPHAVARGLRRREPSIHILVVGYPSAPAVGTSDPDLLHWAEEHGCLFVTNNRATMSGHLRDHLAAGGHVPGILVISRRLSLGDVIDELYLVWAASHPDEYQDRIVYLPLTR